MKNKNLNNVKSSGFKTPDNYFESFDDKLMKRLSENESIEGVSESGFKVPEAYFDTIEDKVFEKLESNNKPVVSLTSRRTWYYISGIAASLVLMFGIFFNDIVEPSSTIDVEMVESYLEDRNLDSYDLAQLLSETDFLEDDFTIAETDYDEDNLEDYLLNHSDIETILEQ